jgi:hypothetical protein|tara:strand:- start:515 stop:2248 length:1734 start_codon:yes stop_codon:yes gene_type:complete
MISLSQLNKLIIFTIFFLTLSFINVNGEDENIDIWEKKESNDETKIETTKEKDLINTSSISLEDSNKIKINESEIRNNEQSIIGIFDPEVNNFNLNMWSETDGEDIKKTLKRIDKLKLSKLSEDLLFQVLFTNSYSPKKNLDTEEFLKIKIDWLIKKKRINDLEDLLKNNPSVGQNSKSIIYLINEYLSSADIKSACDKIKFINRETENSYLEKFKIYCLINGDQKEEAQLIFELLKEKGFKDQFFEDKVNFLLGIADTTSQKILDNNLLNFYFSHVTSDNFKYEPNDKTDPYIWKYLASANLIKVNKIEDENIIEVYEAAAAQNSFDSDEIFKIYLKMNFSFNQLINSQEIYKSLPNYKARALIYQSILLSDTVERKINLALLLKKLFLKDQLLNVYSEELSNILKSINPEDIPKDYEELVKRNSNKNLITKVKFDNDILHRSKVIKHFLEEGAKLNRTEKDFKSIYKKIKKNKKYFISIKDIIVFDSLLADGLILPNDLDYSLLSSQLSVPKNLEDLVRQNQIGLVMLKIVEIIGEDNVSDLDSETLYFLNIIMNQLNLKKIRNDILSEALAIRV